MLQATNFNGFQLLTPLTGVPCPRPRRYVQKSKKTAKESAVEQRLTVLIAAHRAGDPSAANEIVSILGTAVLAKVYAKAPSQLVDDVYQESWFRFFKGLDKEKQPDSYVAWFLGIVRLVSFEMLRQETREAPLPDDAHERYRDLSPTPSQIAEDAELRATLLQCLGKIPERYSRLIIGHLQDAPREALCKELSLALDNYGKLLYRARKSLLKCLGPLARFYDKHR